MIEKMIKQCVPVGQTCDPQKVADDIREFFAENKEAIELIKDRKRIDWLADRENLIGNVTLPTECVLKNMGSLRSAMDCAMEMGQK